MDISKKIYIGKFKLYVLEFESEVCLSRSINKMRMKGQ